MPVFPDYSRSILSLPSSLLAHFGAPAHAPTLPELDEALVGKKQVFWLILDGLGSEVLHRILPEQSFLRRNRAATVTSVFPSTTVAATTSCYSGRAPVEHGWLGWHLYFDELDADVTVFTAENYYTGKRTAPTSPAVTTLPYDTLFQQLRRANPTLRLHALSPFPGHFTQGADTAHRLNSFEQGLAAMKRLAEVPDDVFALMYWPQPDSTMHETGVDSPETRRMYESLSDSLEKFAPRLGDAVLIVSSDHGLINVTGTVDLADHPEVMDMLVRPPSMERRAAAMFVKPGRMDDLHQWYLENLADDFLWIPRAEALRTNLFGLGTPHPRAEGFMGDVLIVAVGARMIDYLPPTLPRKAPMIGHHAGLTGSEMYTDVIIHNNI